MCTRMFELFVLSACSATAIVTVAATVQVVQPIVAIDRESYCLCRYFFENDRGKKVRPALVLLMSYALNASNGVSEVLPSQRRLAEIT